MLLSPFKPRKTPLVTLLCAAAVLTGCANTPENTAEQAITPVSSLSEKAQQEQQQAILKISQQTLRQLHAQKPATKAEIQQAPGYGVFEVNGLNAVLEKTNGRGVVVEKGGQKTYMQLVRTDVAPNRLKPYRQVLVFRDMQKLRQFVDGGGSPNTTRDASIKVYKIDRKGISVQSDWGARYARNPDLNAPAQPQ